jgi:FlaG/FlaF family flagellin (archaellin)
MKGKEMSRSKLGLAGLCVMVVGVMGLGVASAQAAPGWLVLTSGGVVKTAAELPAVLEGEIDGASASLDSHSVKLHVRATCTSGSLSGAKLEASGKLTSGTKIKLKGCKVFNAATGTELPECRIKTSGLAFGEVETSGLKGQLQTNGEIKIEAATGTTLGTLLFEAGCVLPSPTTLNGVLFLEDCEGKAAEHLVEHLLKQGAGTSLFVGADTAEHLETSLVGSLWVFLSSAHSGLKWGAVFP